MLKITIEFLRMKVQLGWKTFALLVLIGLVLFPAPQGFVRLPWDNHKSDGVFVGHDGKDGLYAGLNRGQVVVAGPGRWWQWHLPLRKNPPAWNSCTTYDVNVDLELHSPDQVFIWPVTHYFQVCSFWWKPWSYWVRRL